NYASTIHLYITHTTIISTHPPTTHIYTLSLHDALPISPCHDQHVDLTQRAEELNGPGDLRCRLLALDERRGEHDLGQRLAPRQQDRKSTRLNSSHLGISYAVFCLKKKKNTKTKKYDKKS